MSKILFYRNDLKVSENYILNLIILIDCFFYQFLLPNQKIVPEPMLVTHDCTRGVSDTPVCLSVCLYIYLSVYLYSLKQTQHNTI